MSRYFVSAISSADCTEHLDAHTIKGYVIHEISSNTRVQIPYTDEENRGKAAGRAFHHGRFVMALRTAARSQNKLVFFFLTSVSTCDDAELVASQ